MEVFPALPVVTWCHGVNQDPNLGLLDLELRSNRESQQEPATSDFSGQKQALEESSSQGLPWGPVPCSSHGTLCPTHGQLHTPGLDAGSSLNSHYQFFPGDLLPPPSFFFLQMSLKGYRKAWNKMKTTNEQLQAICPPGK